MKRKARIIQITGIRGIIMLLFTGVCLIAGFVVFPAIVAMYGWNYLASIVSIPAINFLQGLLLWGLIAGSIFVLNDRGKFVTAFNTTDKLSDEELEKVLQKVRLQAQTKILNDMIVKSAKINELKSEQDEDKRIVHIISEPKKEIQDEVEEKRN